MGSQINRRLAIMEAGVALRNANVVFSSWMDFPTLFCGRSGSRIPMPLIRAGYCDHQYDQEHQYYRYHKQDLRH